MTCVYATAGQVHRQAGHLRCMINHIVVWAALGSRNRGKEGNYGCQAIAEG